MRYHDKIRHYNVAFMNLSVSYGDYSPYLGEEHREFLDRYSDLPCVKVRVMVDVTAPDAKAGMTEPEYSICDWRMERVDDERLIIYRDMITRAIDDYIYDHEYDLIAEADLVFVSDFIPEKEVA